MNLFNSNYCQSIKSKNNMDMQCQNKPKQNEIFCGKHLNSVNTILYQSIYEQKKKIKTDNNEDLKKDDNEQDYVIYNKEELFEIIFSNKYINVTSLRKSIKNSDLKFIINTKNSKRNLINFLKIYFNNERYYLSHEDSIILIQSYFRRWLVYRKKKCCNDTDLLTFTSKYDIPNKYFYIFYDKTNNKEYAYDIRTLYQIITSNYPSCPYTCRKFTDTEKYMILQHKNKLCNNGIDINITKAELTPEEEVDMKINDIFYQINMLDNYTNPDWFKNLDLSQLIDLYVITEDIWNYRSNMSIESKKEIVNNGIVFNEPIHIIKMMKSKIKLQTIILNNYLRLITEGINRDEKKLGALLILTGLVEVSLDAKDSLPHLIQN
jgi:hypothetical protein